MKIIGYLFAWLALPVLALVVVLLTDELWDRHRRIWRRK
jgi:hypothetical protein